MSAADKRAVDIPLQDGELVSAATAELDPLPPPLWGRVGEGGGAFRNRGHGINLDPHPRPLPTRGRGAD